MLVGCVIYLPKPKRMLQQLYSRNELRPEVGDKIYNGALEDSFIDESDIIQFKKNPHLFFKLLELVYVEFSIKISSRENFLPKLLNLYPVFQP